MGAFAPVINDTSAPSSSYSIDDGTSTNFTAPLDIATTQYDKAFFQVQGLSPDSEHTLAVNVLYASDNAPYLFDYIGYIPLTQPSTTSSMANAPGTGLPIPSANSSSSKPIGPIIGGVVGGVALVLLAAATLYFYISRRRLGRPYFYQTAQVHDMLAQGEH